MSANKHRFRSARKLGTVLVSVLALNLVLAAVMVVLRISEIGLLQRIGRGELVSVEEANRSDGRVAAVAIAGLVVLLITGILWLVWQHRRMRTSTLRGFGRSSTHLAGRSVGG